MLSLVPPRLFAQRLARADETADRAAEQLYEMRMLEITRLVRDALPSATALVVDARRRRDASEGVRLHSVLAREQSALWSAADAAPTSAVAGPRSDAWDDVVGHIEYSLTSALGPKAPLDRWHRYEANDDGLYVAELNTDDEVSETASVIAGKFGAKLSDDSDRELWLVGPVAAPTMTVGGVRVAARIRPDGKLLIDIVRDLSDGRRGENGTDVEVDVRIDGYTAFPTSIAS